MVYASSTSETATDRYTEFKAQLLSVVFGDLLGLLLFLGALAFFGLYWRVGFFINDNYAIANGLYNAANGSLRVTEIVYGPASGEVMGMVSGQNGRYSRNMGQIVVTLPVFWILEGVSRVTDLRIVLVGLWCGTILGGGALLGRVTGRDRLCQVSTAVVAIGLFALNLSIATELESRWIALLALQLTSGVAAALTGVMVYRLITRLHGQRAGITAGVCVILVTPVGFWAMIPKRHTYMALFAVATVYSFYRSRNARTTTEALRFRALAYGIVGLSTWIQAGEAFAMFVSLVVVDLYTSSSNSRRELRVVVGVFGLSMIPFLVTNLVIAGNPLMPPMLLPRYQEAAAIVSGGGSSASSSASSSLPIWIHILQFFEAVGMKGFEQINRFTNVVSRGVNVLTDPERLMQIFVRSGYIQSVASRDHGEAMNLALLEAMPVASVLILVPQVIVRSVQSRGTLSIEPTDLLVGMYGVVLTLFYLPRLPLHAMITVRYLLPVMPLIVYGVFRFTLIRELLAYPRELGFAYGGSVIIGSQLILTYLIIHEATLGEAFQVHAWLSLVIAGCFSIWLLLRPYLFGRVIPIGAVVFGCLCGLTTSFLLLSGGLYLALDSGFVLPIIQWLSERLLWV